jgi:hypothetical protein
MKAESLKSSPGRARWLATCASCHAGIDLYKHLPGTGRRRGGMPSGSGRAFLALPCWLCRNGMKWDHLSPCCHVKTRTIKPSHEEPFQLHSGLDGRLVSNLSLSKLWV